jgi:hypothetical protein
MVEAPKRRREGSINGGAEEEKERREGREGTFLIFFFRNF